MISKRLVRLFKKKLGNLSFLDDLLSFLNENTLRDHPAVDSLGKLPGLFEQVDIIFSELDNNIVTAEINLHNSTTELADSNKDLYELNLTMSAMVNSLDEAFLLFDEKGICNKLYSKKCEEFFDGTPEGSNILDILNIENRKNFNEWVKHIYSGVLDFEELVDLGPSEFYNHEKKLTISLKYRPIYSNSGTLKLIVLIGRDITDEKEAIEKARLSADQSNMILKTIHDWDSFVSFFDCYNEFIIKFKTWDSKINTNEEFIRILHTIKGTASSLSIGLIRVFIHNKETQFLNLTQNEEYSIEPFVLELVEQLNTLRVDLFKNNHLIFKRYIHSEDKEKCIKDVDLKLFYKTLKDYDCPKEVLDCFYSKMLETNLKELFESFGARIQTVGMNQNKKVVYNVSGNANLSIAPSSYKFFFINLNHLLTNCVYHGIETTEVRKDLGKAPKGSVILSFKEEQNELMIEICDDGAGINVGKIKNKLEENDIDTTHYSEEDCINGIFEDGVSTEEFLNHSAGRGVGMSSLKQSILDLKGSINVTSKEGQGSVFKIKLPLHRGEEYHNL